MALGTTLIPGLHTTKFKMPKNNDRPNGPPRRHIRSPHHAPHLRHVFNDGDRQLDVGEHVEEPEPVDHATAGHNGSDDDNKGKHHQQTPGRQRHRLVPPLWREGPVRETLVPRCGRKDGYTQTGSTAVGTGIALYHKVS